MRLRLGSAYLFWALGVFLVVWITWLTLAVADFRQEVNDLRRSLDRPTPVVQAGPAAVAPAAPSNKGLVLPDLRNEGPERWLYEMKEAQRQKELERRVQELERGR